MYGAVLEIHGAWRWIVIATLLAAFLEAAIGARARASRAVAWVADTQLALGLVLLVISPVVRGGSADARYFYSFHAPAMVLAVILAHVGSMSARRRAKNWRLMSALSLSAALAAVLSALPWSRPLLRLLG